MAPIHQQELHIDVEDIPMSRTHQYRKVMKPLLERKRRARINKCLDDLKDLMVEALQAEGESITKLEKADVLELTVRHLQKLKRQQMLQANPALDLDRFRSGFTTCATEVSRFMSAVPGVDTSVGIQLMTHLGSQLNGLDRCAQPLTIQTSAAPQQLSHPMSSHRLPMSPSSDGGYNSGRDSTPSPPLSVGSPSPSPQADSTTKSAVSPLARSTSPVWRPF